MPGVSKDIGYKLRVPEQVYDALQNIAKRDGETLAKTMRKALAQYAFSRKAVEQENHRLLAKIGGR